MLCDLHGIKIYYRMRFYTGLSILDHCNVSYTSGEFRVIDAEKLRIAVINDDGKFDILNDFVEYFDFRVE